MICGEQVGLRPLLEADLEYLAQWRKSPDVQAMFYSPFLLSETVLRNWHLALLNDATRMRFMIQRLWMTKRLALWDWNGSSTATRRRN